MEYGFGILQTSTLHPLGFSPFGCIKQNSGWRSVSAGKIPGGNNNFIIGTPEGVLLDTLVPFPRGKGSGEGKE